MEDADIGSITLLDMQGKVVRQLAEKGQLHAGYSAAKYSVGGLAAGTYLLSIKTTQRILTKQIEVH
jgi:hypothetical protein